MGKKRISEDAARECKRRLLAGEGTYAEIAAANGVSEGTVKLIQSGKHWSNRDPLPAPPHGGVRQGNRFASEDAHPAAKLTAEQGREIRRRLEAGEPAKDLASEFEVSVPTIAHIRNGRHWSVRSYGKIPTNLRLGETHFHARLTAEQGQEIQRRLWAGERTKNLADEFDVSVVVIHKIKHGRHWSVRGANDPPDWLTAAHAAEFIGVNGEAVIDWIRKGWVHGIVVERGKGAPPIYAVSGAEVIRARAQWQGRGSLRPDLAPPREPQFDICAHCGEEFCDCAEILHEAESAKK